MTAIQALAFGDLEAGTWGLTWVSEPGGSSRVAVRRDAAADVLEAQLVSNGVGDGWRLDGGGMSLAFDPTAPTGHGGVPGELETSDRICRVTGRLTVGGEASELECLGWHGVVHGQGELSAVASFRWLAAWLGPSDGFSLIALRPRKARAHGADLIAASLIEDTSPPQIDDPRLSTTYTDGGLPIRAGLELWPEAHHDEGPDEDETPRYPRRAAAEAVGAGLAWDAGGFQLHGAPLRWRSHGHMGPGVYLLGQRA